jgi:addiction module HigA family antidote
MMLPKNRISTHPGRVLLHEFLQPMGLTQAALARELRVSQNRLNEIVRGKRGLTAETALLLSAYFGNSPEFWMHLQVAYDLTKARQELSRKPARRAEKARRLARPA